MPTTLLSHLREQPEDVLRRRGWERVTIEPESRLFEAGDVVDALYVIEQGRVAVLADAVEIDSLGEGECLGEASVFFPAERRSATAVAREPTTAWRLGREALRRLRGAEPEAHDRLLELALAELWARLERRDREIVGLGRGRLPPPRAAGPLGSLWQRLRQSVATVPEPLAALGQVPVLSWCSRELLVELAQGMQAMRVSAGQALFLQGDEEQELYVLARGKLAIVRQGAGEVAEELAVLDPGALFGVGGFVAGSPRTASAIAREDAWVLGISRDAAAGLSLPARRALFEATLAAMRGQLRGANALLAARERPEESFGDLIAAVGLLEGWQAGDPRTELRLEDLVEPAALPRVPGPIEEVFATIRGAVIGRDDALETPYGLKRVVYADYTASGRSLAFIEDFIRDRVMPMYANTHTEASASGLQTTRFREEARALVARSVGASDEDEVIFVGSGATGAINRLIDILGLRRPVAQPAGAEPPELPAARRPVVFIGPYEHHSNILPWRHSWADVVSIPVDARGLIDLEALEAELVRHADRPLKIGSFSAGSNVTGIATDVDAIATLLHRHRALSFWDYAAAGPYVPIRMNPEGGGEEARLAAKDAVFISPHKFVGGPQTPGVLVLKKSLARSNVPSWPGGGTVDFVTGGDTLYSDSLKHREESGTPAIIESIRCGLVFQLKDRVGGDTIHHREQELVRTAIDSWTRNPAIRVLGPTDAQRLSIVSFMVRHGRGFLHHNFLVAVLNDLFGIQSRGGCSCAGPYGAVLLGMQEADGAAFLELSAAGYHSLKPGWTRVNFNYFISEAEFRYVVDAVNLVAAYGWALMPDYEFEPHDGLWHHRRGSPYEPAHLSDLKIEGGAVTWPSARRELPEAALADALAEGRERLLEASRRVPEPLARPELPDSFEARRWFPLPHEVAAWMRHGVD